MIPAAIYSPPVDYFNYAVTTYGAEKQNRSPVFNPTDVNINAIVLQWLTSHVNELHRTETPTLSCEQADTILADIEATTKKTPLIEMMKNRDLRLEGAVDVYTTSPKELRDFLIAVEELIHGLLLRTTGGQAALMEEEDELIAQCQSDLRLGVNVTQSVLATDYLAQFSVKYQ
jgi:hypothetical protein